MARSLEGQRVVVVGASAGIGREFAMRAIRDGAKVIMAARRTERLEELAEEAGGGITAAVDIRHAHSCAELAERVRWEFGAADLLVCSAGYSPLRYFTEASAEDWQNVLSINVVGIHQLIRNLLPVANPGALFAVLSSESTMQPRHALGVYTASKAALELSMRVWRQEEPRVRFTTLVVGGTFPTDFGAEFDPEVLVPAMEDWARHGVVQERLMATEEVADVMVGTLASIIDLPEISLDTVVLRSSSPVVGGSEHLAETAAENFERLNADG